MRHSAIQGRRARCTLIAVAAALAWACGGSVSSSQGNTGGSGSSAGAPGAGGSGSSPGAGGTGSSPGAGGTGGVPNPPPLCAGKPMEVPTQHRAAAAACPTDPQGTDCDAGLGTGCGPHCMSDSDCSPNQVCTCDGTAFGWAHQSQGNICVPSNCRTDADCASGYCSPSIDFSMGPFYGVAGYYCHSCADECINDSDCLPVGGHCAYDPTVGHWACMVGGAAG